MFGIKTMQIKINFNVCVKASFCTGKQATGSDTCLEVLMCVELDIANL